MSIKPKPDDNFGATATQAMKEAFCKACKKGVQTPHACPNNGAAADIVKAEDLGPRRKGESCRDWLERVSEPLGA